MNKHRINGPGMRGAVVATLVFLSLGAAPLSAQTFITGTVTDWMGNPVAGVDIDALDDNGDPANLGNDGTDAAGNFLTSMLDGPGMYDVIFNPPAGMNLLPVEIKDQFIIGTVNLGTIALPLGYPISGTIVDPLMVGLQGVDLNVIDAVSGDDVTPDKDKTGALGEFSLMVPPGTFDLEVDPAPTGFAYAPAQVLGVVVNAPASVGTIVLEQGFTVSATIRDSGGAPLQGIDVDVVDSLTGVQLYTPGDNSDASGFVDVVVPAGTFDVEIEPNKLLRLVAQNLMGQVVVANTSLGDILLQDGWQLSGRVTDNLANPLFDVDVDAFDPGSGAEIHLPGSHTDAAGNYLVVVPQGTTNVVYIPDLTAPQRGKTMATVVTSDRIQDVMLDDCPLPVHYGTGNPGSGGLTPTIESVGDLPRAGVPDFQIQIDNGIGGGRAILLIGLVKLNVQGDGWTMLVNPLLRFTLPLSGPNGVPGAGQFTLSSPLPPDPNLDGLHLYLQGWVPDFGAQGNLATTDGLDIEFCQ